MKELTVTLSYPGEAQPVTWKIESALGSADAIKSINASLKEAGKNNVGRKKTHDKPSAETLRRDFTSIARENLRLNGTQIADRMKASYHVKYASVPSSTIVRWLSEDGISIKEIKRSVRAQINLDK
jgi:type II secretory pathway component PulM